MCISGHEHQEDSHSFENIYFNPCKSSHDAIYHKLPKTFTGIGTFMLFSNYCDYELH